VASRFAAGAQRRAAPRLGILDERAGEAGGEVAVSIIAVLLLGFIAVLAFGVAVVAVVVVAIKRSVSRAANQAVSAIGAAGGGLGSSLNASVAAATRGLGHGVGNQAIGMLLRVGEGELKQGIAFVKKTMDEELLKSDPKRMQMVVAKLAQQNAGELTAFQVMTELSISQRLALDTLGALAAQQVCFTREDGQRTVYVFPAFKTKRDVKVCEYCDSTFELDETGESCGACGAPGLQVVSTIS
jgi:hypothetical protein